MTKAIPKQLITSYDKRMINYPLNVLLPVGTPDILMDSAPQDLILYKSLLSE